MSAQTPKPNVVIIMTDQQRADLCGREGFPMAVTPFADSLALSNVWFDKAYTVAPARYACALFHVYRTLSDCYACPYEPQHS